jgi:serine/threonine protein kinase
MGSTVSKSKINELEEQHKLLMKQNADMAIRLAEQEEASKRQHEATVEQIARMILALVQSNANETVISNEKREIEIEGTTYELVQFVNRGGFGEIHKAKVKNKNIMVAIKVMQNTPGLQEEIKNEINFLRLAKQIPIENHPIIEYYGSKIMKEGILIAMELAACDLLSFWVSKISDGKSDEIAVIGMIIIVYVLRALTFLEELNIIHGDIKPQNLVIVPNEQAFCIKLIDFGTVEKMNTLRAQQTVDASKGFTLFFVSPEFLKRNSKNLVSRHLHKKSDAWAAGVMFYLLFCGELPWKDQFDYENFCNDRNAKDIVVPDIGGYKLIIDLLLKKNPNERSSAKATLMQLKAHPAFGKIVQSLHENFCPVDDVCSMRVPNNVRQGLRKLITQS